MSAEAVLLPASWLGLAGQDEGDWRERALCAQTDPEAFFPEKGGSTREAKRICLGCEVRAECLEEAMATDERFGIWGGLSERERRTLRSRMAAGQSDPGPGPWMSTRQAAEHLGIRYDTRNGTTRKLRQHGLEPVGNPDGGPYRWDRQQVLDAGSLAGDDTRGAA